MASEADPAAGEFSAVAARLLPGARLLGVRRLTGGVSADVHAVEIVSADGEQRTVVVRRHRTAEWKPRQDNAARTEFELLQAVHRAGVPVAEPLLLDTSGKLLPGPFLVTGFVDGTTEIPARSLDACLDVMAATLAEVHALPTEGLPHLPPRTDPLPELFEYLPQTAGPALRRHLERCTDSACTQPAVLLHGDFWPGNLLWQDGRLAAVLDWEDAALGDPLSDLAGARLELLWCYGPAAVERFTRSYSAGRRLDTRRLALWQVYVASAAAHFMGAWGLDADREAAMREQAEAFVQDSAAILLASGHPAA